MSKNRIDVAVVFTYSGPNRDVVLQTTLSTSDERDTPRTLELRDPKEIQLFFDQVDAARHVMALHSAPRRAVTHD